MELQSVWQLIEELIIFGAIPTIGQGIGMGVAIAGSIIVSLEFEFCQTKEDVANRVKASRGVDK